jgi:hypothetical protein
MTDDHWSQAADALDHLHAAGRRIDVWLRDDDCVSVTPALERLVSLCGAVELPILLAVIPTTAEETLAPWLRAHPGVTPCQHGFAHANYAPQGEKAREIGGRLVATVLDELARGRTRLQSIFGAALSDVLVPPWNRIDAEVIPHLPGLGFSALSCFAPTPPTSPIARLDSDLDIVDWRGGRVGRSLDDLARKIAGIVERQDRLGILTHHLAHDEVAWINLGEMLNRLAEHPAVRWTAAAGLLNSRA